MHHRDSVLMIFLCPTCQLPVKAAFSHPSGLARPVNEAPEAVGAV